MNEVVTSAVSVGLAIIGLAAVAVLVSRNAQTTQVVSSAGGAFSGAIGTALSPITGGGSTFPNLSNAGSFQYQ